MSMWGRLILSKDMQLRLKKYRSQSYKVFNRYRSGFVSELSTPLRPNTRPSYIHETHDFESHYGIDVIFTSRSFSCRCPGATHGNRARGHDGYATAEHYRTRNGEYPRCKDCLERWQCVPHLFQSFQSSWYTSGS